MVDDRGLADFPRPFDVASCVRLIEELRRLEAEAVLSEEVGGYGEGVATTIITVMKILLQR